MWLRPSFFCRTPTVDSSNLREPNCSGGDSMWFLAVKHCFVSNYQGILWFCCGEKVNKRPFSSSMFTCSLCHPRNCETLASSVMRMVPPNGSTRWFPTLHIFRGRWKLDLVDWKLDFHNTHQSWISTQKTRMLWCFNIAIADVHPKCSSTLPIDLQIPSARKSQPVACSGVDYVADIDATWCSQVSLS